jgi:hypothetical protein
MNLIFMMQFHNFTSTRVPSHNFQLQEVHQNLSCTPMLVHMTPGTMKNCDSFWDLAMPSFLPKGQKKNNNGPKGPA